MLVVVDSFSFSLPFVDDEGFDWGVGRPLKVLPDPPKAGGSYVQKDFLVKKKNERKGR